MTLSLALGGSLLVDRVAPAIYAAAGEEILPSDIEDARSRAVRAPEVSVRTVGWLDGRFEIEVEVFDLTMWNGFVKVPREGNLEGRWTLSDGEDSWTIVVEGSQLRNGVRPWLRRQKWEDEFVVLRFDHGSRTLTASLRAPSFE